MSITDDPAIEHANELVTGAVDQAGGHAQATSDDPSGMAVGKQLYMGDP
jgi:hypothetical protein